MGWGNEVGYGGGGERGRNKTLRYFSPKASLIVDKEKQSSDIQEKPLNGSVMSCHLFVIYSIYISQKQNE